MDNTLQPIDLIAQELSEKTMQLAHYKVAYNELSKELEAKEKEIEELKKAKEEVKHEEVQ
ncbi:hypothetical protein [uncultured Gemella sp.]|uniref:hypothetical protein n=1 Tax=uncultured Gemella sp. TaxID=254352 RepID=UPI0028D88A5D|nr:hypothetical protein [uncultured Gemella sp.]